MFIFVTLKSSENGIFFDVFRVYTNWTLAQDGLKILKCIFLHKVSVKSRSYQDIYQKQYGCNYSKYRLFLGYDNNLKFEEII